MRSPGLFAAACLAAATSTPVRAQAPNGPAAEAQAWHAQLRSKVVGRLEIPDAVRRMEQGACVTIRFTLFEDGRIQAVAVRAPSGAPQWDAAVIAAFRAAAPLPKPPSATVQGHRAAFVLPFAFAKNRQQRNPCSSPVARGRPQVQSVVNHV